MAALRRRVDSHTNPLSWGWQIPASLAIALAILGGLLTRLDVVEIWRQVAAANMTLVILGGLAHYATYVIRGVRWRRSLIHVLPSASVRMFSLLVFFYNAVDNIVPAKLTDVYAAHLARINCGVERAAALGSLVFLRMLDAWVVLMFAALASWMLFAFSLPPLVLWSLWLGMLLAVGATGILLTCVLCRWTLLTRLPDRLHHALRAFQVGMWPNPRQFIPIVGLTAIIWALETLSMVGLVAAFGMSVQPCKGLFLTAMPLLASAFPLTPSGVGVVELTLFSSLRLLDVSTVTAMSVTVVNRLIDYWLHIVLGVFIWTFRRLIGLQTWREVPVEDNC